MSLSRGKRVNALWLKRIICVNCHLSVLDSESLGRDSDSDSEP